MRPLEYMSIFADMKHLSAFMLALVALAASARPDGRDTVSGIHVLPHDSVAYAPPMSLVYKAAYTPAPMSGTLFGERPSLTALDLMPDGGVSITPGEAVIHSWPSGAIVAAGGIAHMPGMMGVESGSVSFIQDFGRFSLALDVSASKYGYFRGMGRSFGFGGSLSYEISPSLGITVFGSYHTDAGITRHAMMGYVDVPTFGGYVDWRAGDRWGVKVGAKGYRPSGGNRWEAQPIVMPYFRFNGKDDIGLDIGGIMYNLLRSNIGGGWGAVRNPTIPPPIP